MKVILKVTGIFLVLFCAFSNLSCTDVRKLQYETNADHDKLLALKGKNVAVLSFRYNPGAFLQKPLEHALVELILERHRLIFKKEFAGIFNLKDLSQSSPLNRDLDPHDRAAVRDAIKAIGMDGAFVVDSAYGYSEQALTQYYLASNALLLDSEGNIVWSFYGKIWGLQKYLDYWDPQEFARELTKQSKIPTAFAPAMASFAGHYSAFLSWLMETDLKGSMEKNYFVYYPKERRSKLIAVYPASHKTVPYILDLPKL